MIQSLKISSKRVSHALVSPCSFCLFVGLIYPAYSQTNPELQLEPSGSLNWTSAPHSWMPLTAATVTSPNWSVVTAPVVATGYSNAVALPQANSSQFYLLEKRGAVVPFVTLETEAANRITGQIIALTNSPTSTTWTPELEASGRAFVQLTNTSDFLEFSNVVAANTIVLRHCIPDAPTGGGLAATLSLYVNGAKHQTLTLTSTNNWLYQTNGITASENGQDNNPAGGPAHVFWDESRYFITNGVQQGDVLKLQKDATDTAVFYRLDSIDLEVAPPPLSPPPAGTYLSITSYGANGSDNLDDTTAIKNCLTAAKALGKIAWLPPGTYYQNASITVDSVTVQGAGMWHTSLIQTQDGTKNLIIKGNAPKVSDLFIANSATTYRISGGYAFTLVTPCTNWVVENVWITHTSVGIWMTDGVGGTVRGCRVRLTYADAINLNKGASGCLVEHNHVRGAGDDGLAILADLSGPFPSTNNILRYNTVIANWWGHNCSLAGGYGHLIENNYLADNSHSGCLAINLPSAYQKYPLTGGIIRRNTILRGGSNFVGQKRGAFWVSSGSTTISNVLFQENFILGALFPAVHLTGSSNQVITFDRNVIDAPGTEGIRVNAEVNGAGSFISNIVRNLKPGVTQFTNIAGGDYPATLTGNSWP